MSTTSEPQGSRPSPPRREQRGPRPADEALSAAPGVARIAASAWWHTMEWTVGTSVKGTRRLLQAATSPESALELVEEVQEIARGIAASVRVPGREAGSASPREDSRGSATVQHESRNG